MLRSVAVCRIRLPFHAIPRSDDTTTPLSPAPHCCSLHTPLHNRPIPGPPPLSISTRPPNNNAVPSAPPPLPAIRVLRRPQRPNRHRVLLLGDGHDPHARDDGCITPLRDPAVGATHVLPQPRRHRGHGDPGLGAPGRQRARRPDGPPVLPEPADVRQRRGRGQGEVESVADHVDPVRARVLLSTTLPTWFCILLSVCIMCRVFGIVLHCALE